MLRAQTSKQCACGEGVTSIILKQTFERQTVSCPDTDSGERGLTHRTLRVTTACILVASLKNEGIRAQRPHAWTKIPYVQLITCVPSHGAKPHHREHASLRTHSVYSFAGFRKLGGWRIPVTKFMFMLRICNHLSKEGYVPLSTLRLLPSHS